MVYVYYPELRRTLISEKQKINLLDLLSLVGGTFGLFIGFSLVSIVDGLQIVFRTLVNTFGSRRVKTKNLPSEKFNKIAIEKNIDEIILVK